MKAYSKLLSVMLSTSRSPPLASPNDMGGTIAIRLVIAPNFLNRGNIGT